MGARIKEVSVESLLKKPVEDAKWMHLDIGRKAFLKMKLRVPHQDKPMTVQQMEKTFPEFAKMLDGDAQENTIKFFWKLDKTSGIYEFIGPDEEDEVAEELGVELQVVEEEPDEEFGELKGEALSAEAQAEFHAEMKEMRVAITSFLEKNS